MPGPERSRNFAIVESGSSGASSWMQEPESPTADHRLADALLLVGLLVDGLHAEGVAVEGDRLVEVGHGDADVVDGGEQVRGQVESWQAHASSARASVARPSSCERFPHAGQVSRPRPRRAPWVSSRGDRASASCRRHPCPDPSSSPAPARPIGRLLGGLKDLSAADLGGVAIKGALEKAGVSGDQVDYVIMGQVIQAGAGQNPARTAAVAGGIPMNVPSHHHQQGLPLRHQRDRAWPTS